MSLAAAWGDIRAPKGNGVVSRVQFPLAQFARAASTSCRTAVNSASWAVIRSRTASRRQRWEAQVPPFMSWSCSACAISSSVMPSACRLRASKIRSTASGR